MPRPKKIKIKIKRFKKGNIKTGKIQNHMKKSLHDSPSVFPRTSQHLLLTLFHIPLCISLDRSHSCRAREMISPITNSATLRELLKGELNTAMPCVAAYWRSTWFVPIQKQPMTMRLRASLSTRSVSLVLDRMPMTCTSLDREGDISGSVLLVFFQLCGAVRCGVEGPGDEGSRSSKPDLFNQLILR